ncbi:MAG: hypothetical protein HZA53_19570 [Planctomycetes bacterium]|nr:hypothetical protein [Planctomycetota bacterium]
MPAVILGSTFLFLGLAFQGTLRPSESDWSFERDVRGLFRAQCLVCHGPDEQKGGLRLDQRASLFERGDPLVVPGAPEESELLRRLTTTDADERMPKDRAPLSAEALARLRAWIADGAPWNDADERARHWAYAPPTRPTMPSVRDAAWCRNELDRFVLARGARVRGHGRVRDLCWRYGFRVGRGSSTGAGCLTTGLVERTAPSARQARTGFQTRDPAPSTRVGVPRGGTAPAGWGRIRGRKPRRVRRLPTRMPDAPTSTSPSKHQNCHEHAPRGRIAPDSVPTLAPRGRCSEGGSREGRFDRARSR